MRLFSRRTGLALVVVAGGYLAARSWETLRHAPWPELASTPAAPAPAGSDAPGGWVDGNDLVRRVVGAVEGRPNIAARFRHAVRVGDELLSGSGQYWQQGRGNTRRTCWQWTALVAGQTAAFSQILDKNGCVWTDVRLPERRTVTRVDANRVRRDVEAALAGQGRGVAESATLELLARGGLAQTLAELQRSFHFAPPVAVTVEGHDALALVGQWRDELLGRRWPGAVGASGAQWPAPLPHHVLLVVGARDFFPYVIEYRRGADETWASTPHASPDPLARFEFYAVDFAAAMREEMFEFRANDVQWRDATSLMVQRLLPRAAPAPQVQTAAGSAPWRQ